MSDQELISELYEERRRKWRRSGFRRGILATVLGLVALGVVLGMLFGSDRPTGPHIARYEITGLIRSDALREADLHAIAEDQNARALIVAIDSGGGTTVGSEALYEALRDVAAEKPVVAVMGEAAASGAYITALAADHIVARGNTLTGSIGVILEVPNLTGLMERVGVDVLAIRSSEIKGDPSLFRDLTPQSRALAEDLVADSHAWFLGLVAERRGLTAERAAELGDGRVYTGRMAAELGLIDELGGEEAALAWLAAQDPSLEGLDVATWIADDGEGAFGGLGSLIGTAASGDLLDLLPSPRLMSITR